MVVIQATLVLLVIGLFPRLLVLMQMVMVVMVVGFFCHGLCCWLVSWLVLLAVLSVLDSCSAC